MKEQVEREHFLQVNDTCLYIGNRSGGVMTVQFEFHSLNNIINRCNIMY